jgi:hypothetical protein
MTRRLARWIPLCLGASALVPESAWAQTTEAAPVATGVVGRVTDSVSHSPIADAQVRVVGGDGTVVLTDLDGRFELPASPGVRTVRVFAGLHLPVRVENVLVRPGRTARIEVTLESREVGPAQEAIVAGRADTGTAATVLEQRRQSAAVSDGVSAQEIARSPDTTASDSIRRVVGVSLRDQNFVVVRGLGGRYVNALLNGAPLPPTDPDQPGVQLDLFPASLLNSLTLNKTFTSDMPGDFAGGSLSLTTRDFPQRLLLQLSVSAGADTNTHTGRVLGARGGGLDALGFDDGTRALPASVPPVFLRPGSHGLSADDIAAVARTFENHWSVQRVLPRPNLSGSVTVGNTLRLRGRPLGFLFSFSYGNTLRRADETIRSLRISDGTLGVRETLEQESATRSVLWGALANLSFSPAEHHSLSLIGLWNQSSDDEVRVRSGYNETAGVELSARQLRLVERSLFFAQLLGDHQELPGRARVQWQLFGSHGQRSEPDNRTLTYQRDPMGYRIAAGEGSVGRLFSELGSREVGGRLDVTVPISRLTLRGGAMVRLSDRSFQTRRFTYENAGLPAESAFLGPEQFFAPENLRAGGLEFQERTTPTDSYAWASQSYAPYLRLDLSTARDRLRFVLGARFESFHQSLDPNPPFQLGANSPSRYVDRTDDDVLPSAAVVWALSPRMNLRGAYGGTVARPLVRELAPINYEDFIRNRSIVGNPSLQRTFVHNADVRWEWFPTPGEVLAVSLFAKEFESPIEPQVRDNDGNLSFVNAAGARNLGAEIEGRINLGRIAPSLRSFVLGANLALIHSSVRLGPDQQGKATNAERPLAGQSPYLANVTLGWQPQGGRVSAFVYYNLFGPRIEEVGIRGFPDVYVRPVHQLDATVSWELRPGLTLRVIGRNLAYQPKELEQGGFVLRAPQAATSVTLRLAWTY